MPLLLASVVLLMWEYGVQLAGVPEVILPSPSSIFKVMISKNEIFFRPHKLNIGELSDKYFKIVEIESFEKSAFPLFLKILTKDNRVMFLSTWSRNKIIESIRRRQF